MLNDLMKQIKTDKQKKIQTNKNVNVNIPQTQKQTTKKVVSEEDDIAKMLANLG